jgi:hypothetical protein
MKYAETQTRQLAVLVGRERGSLESTTRSVTTLFPSSLVKALKPLAGAVAPMILTLAKKLANKPAPVATPGSVTNVLGDP